LEALRRVNVSPKRQGLLDALYVDEGDQVQKGQVLARMDAGDFRDRMDELMALERQARAENNVKAAEYQRQLQLFRAGAITAAALDDERAQMVDVARI